MNIMKKTLSILLALTLTLSLFLLTSCKNGNGEKGEQTDKATDSKDVSDPNAPENDEKKPESIRAIALSGPTGMGMAKLIDDAENGKTEYKYEFEIATAPDQVSPEIIKGSYDIAAVPVNLASVLYNKTKGELKVAAVNTLGVLYMLENGNEIKSVADLKGKTIYATGQGSNPEYVLRYVLAKNNIDPDKDVKIEFLAEHAELAAKLKTGDVAIGMLPEPQVSAATMGNDKTRIALDLTEEWNKVSEYQLVQGCIVVNKKFAEEHPKALEGFLKEYKASVEYANENVEEAASLIEKAGILPSAAIAKAALPKCNVCFVAGEEMKNMVKQTLTALFEANPASVGGKLPEDEFYY